MGHSVEECGDGVHAPKDLVFKDLKASWFKGPGRGPGEGRGANEGSGSRGGRGNGRSGRGQGRGSTSTSVNAREIGENKRDQDISMEDIERNRKRGATLAISDSSLMMPAAPESSTQQLLLLPPEIPASPSVKQEPKRNKPSLPANDNTVVKKLVPNRQNCLAEQSAIYLSEGTVKQDVVLRLRNVECGEVELQLQGIDIPGSKGASGF